MSDKERKSRVNSALIDISRDLASTLISTAKVTTERQMSIVRDIAEDLKSDIIRRRSSVFPVQLEKTQENLSDFELLLLRSKDPLEVDEKTLQILTVGQDTGFWLNKKQVDSWRGDIDIAAYAINVDSNPEIVRKSHAKKLEYVQELSIRYLRPMTPPRPGDLVVEQLASVAAKPAPPVIIRQVAARPKTPKELVIREAPPKLPARIEEKTITIKGRRLPPPPRKVIIEQLAAEPAQPPAVIVERWLPFPKQNRKVIFKTHPEPVVEKPPRNLIIKWSSPEYEIKQKVKYLGVSRMDTEEYTRIYGSSLIKSKDLPEIATSIATPDDLTLAASVTDKPVEKLVGDLEALKLIDLEAQGLGRYRKQLGDLLGASPKNTRFLNDTIFSELESYVDTNSNGKITVNEARAIFNRINSRLGKTYTQDEEEEFFMSLKLNRDGCVSCSRFKDAFESLDETLRIKREQQQQPKRKLTAFLPKASGKQSGRILACPIGEVCTLDEIFEDMDVDQDGMITKDETAQALLRINSTMRKSYGQDELEVFFSTLDRDRKGSIALKDFKEVLTTIADDETYET